MASGDVTDSALQGGLLGSVQERGEAETNREQFSEEVLIVGVRNCFTPGHGRGQENRAGLGKGNPSAPHTNATVNYT